MGLRSVSKSTFTAIGKAVTAMGEAYHADRVHQFQLHHYELGSEPTMGAVIVGAFFGTTQLNTDGSVCRNATQCPFHGPEATLSEAYEARRIIRELSEEK